MDSLIETTKAIWITETLENYPIAFKTEIESFKTDSETPNEVIGHYGYNRHYIDDQHFWEAILQNPDGCWEDEISLEPCCFTEWVARVPGLYWKESSPTLRMLANKLRLYGSGKDNIYTPLGKSMHVSGGIGTLKIPPDEKGICISSVSTMTNASAGIPILIYPEVIEHHKLKNGDIIYIQKAKWRKMSSEWQSKFPSIAGIPRGYLVVDKPEKLRKLKHNCSIATHPFSILQYQTNTAFLYDFVYVTLDAADPKSRGEAIEFFESYRNNPAFQGEYLLAVDPSNPFFDALYTFPQDLEKTDGIGKTQLSLIKERIKMSYYGNLTIEQLAGIISRHYHTVNDIYRIADNIGISPSLIREDATAKMAIVLINQAIIEDVMPKLVDQVLKDNPQLIR